MMPNLIEQIKNYQIIKIVSNSKKYNRDVIIIDRNIFYRQYKPAFMLTIDLKNGDLNSTSFYLKYIIDNLTITQEEFLNRLKIVKEIILREYK